MDRIELLETWSSIFGRTAPKGLSQSMLRRFLAYELQARRLCGLSKKAKVALARKASTPARPSKPALEGQSFSEIAHAEGNSKRRIQDVVDLAMLAPDIMDAIEVGEQPDGLTSDYLIKTGAPTLWIEQRAAFANL